MSKLVFEMTDLEFVDHWIDNSEFINPILFRELRARGLYDITNRLSGDRNEQRAIARARMAKIGRYIGDPEIEEIAGHIDRIKAIKASMWNCKDTDVKELIDLTGQLTYHANFVKDYFKEPR